MSLDFGFIRIGDIRGIKAQIEAAGGKEKASQLVNKPITIAKLSPIFLAAFFGHPDLVNLLVENGANVDELETLGDSAHGGE